MAPKYLLYLPEGYENSKEEWPIVFFLHGKGDLMKLFESIESDLKIDKKRIYITGLSMGGFGTWDLITRYPDI